MKKTFQFLLSTLLLIGLTIFSSFGQVAEWSVVNPGIGTSTCMDQFNNSFTCGQYIGPATIGSTTFPGYGVQDIVVQKYDPTGNLLWATDFGGTQSDYSQKMTYDGFGNVWVTGQFSGTMTAGAFTLNSAGGSDVYVVKIDAASGDIVSAQRAGNSGNDVGMAIAADQFGDIYLAGTFNSSFTFGSVSIAGLGTYEVFLVKLTNAGVPMWGSGITGTSIETMWSMAVDNMGNSYIGGYSSSATANFNGTNQNFTGQTHFIAKFDNVGAFDWISTSSFSGEIDGLAADDLGNVYFTGNFDTQATFGSTTLTGVGMDDILIGDVYVVGTFQGIFSIGGTNINSGGPSKSFIFKINTSGTVQWVEYSYGGSLHISKGVVVNENDDIFLTGWGSGSFSMGGYVVDLSLGGYLVKLSDNANVIEGTVFTDDNADGLMDLGEVGVPNVILALNGGPYVTSSNNSGEYNMFTASGSQSVSIPNVPLYHTLSTPAVQNFNFVGMGNIDTFNLFGLTPIPNMNDLKIDITPISAPKAGYVLTYVITYTNQGTTSQNATVSLQADALLAYLGTTPVATNVSGQSITWDLGVLAPQENGTLFAQFNIPSNLLIGNLLQSTVSISPTLNDQTPSNNTQLSSAAVTGPYDPNYKEVNIDTLYDVVNSDYLEYIIHFQNIGNDTAYNVIILDTLSSYLDLTSMEIISKSHPMLNFNITNGNVAEFRFNNIMLPDSLTDPIGSNGFVKFRVKYISSVPLFTSIDNFADIYFDYNEAIRTDTASTYFTTVTAEVSENVEIKNLKVYPNPTNNELNFIFNKVESLDASVRVYSLAGTVLTQQIFDNSATEIKSSVQLGNYASGIYFVEFFDGKNTQQVKVIKH
jgi:uncharacterized repeat protein (TIGR01451 family)